MKNNIALVIFMLLMGFVACAFSAYSQTLTNSYKIYRDEDLLYAYLEKFFKEDIHHEDFALLTFRTNTVCRTCRKFPLDSVLILAMQREKILYVLFDNEKDMKDIKKIHGDKIFYLYGESKTMSRYISQHVEPLLFTFRKKKLTKCEYLSNG